MTAAPAVASPYADSAVVYYEAGCQPFPVPPRKKDPPPKGFTGALGKVPSRADVQTWIETRPGGNIALRLNRDQLGLDFDAYGKKRGGKTLAELEAKLGKLPATWRSSARDDDRVSGIRVYRVPEGLKWGDDLPGIEIIHFGHRYMIVWPSIHPDIGCVYRWYAPDGTLSDRVPRPDELPELPEAWVTYLTGGELATSNGHGEVVELVEFGTAGQPCQAVRRAMGDYRELVAEGIARHDAMVPRQVPLVRLGEQGHVGVAEALSVIRTEFLADVTGDRTRTTARASAEWQDALDGAVRLVSRTPTPEAKKGCCSPVAVHSGQGEALNLSDEFWQAQPSLAHIRQAAHSHGRPADVVFGATLARQSAMVSHRLRADTGLGLASLNTSVAIIGPSGRGKSSGVAVARELLEVPGYLTGGAFRDGLGVGSGEGIAESFMGTVEEPTGETYKSGSKRGEPKFAPVRKQVRHNVFVYVDEGQALTAMISRTGATIGPTLRSAFGGEALGQANAREETTRHLPAGSYSLGLLIGFQESTVQPMLADADAGTPQRFLFCSATDPSVPATAPDYPGPLAVDLTDDLGMSLQGTIPFADEIRAELWTANLRRVRGEVDDGDPLDSHESLVRCKVAALLALLDGRREVTAEDWQLSAMVWETSCAVRSALVSYGREEAGKVTEARADAYVVREARAQVARSQAGGKVERIAAQLARKIHTDGALTRGYAKMAVAGRDKALFGEALEHAVSRGWLAADELKVSPGTSKPAES